RHLAWPVLTLVPDIGGEVARASGRFFEQEGNQRVIDELLARGVVPGDEHAPSPKLRQKLDAGKALAGIGIPKLTEKRAAELVTHFADAKAALAAAEHHLVAAGMPADTAAAFVAWRGETANAGLLERTFAWLADLQGALA